MRKICIVTNTRADYSRLKTVIKSLSNKKDVDLSLCVGGAHLLPIQGNTISDIEKDGFVIDHKIYSVVDGYVLSTMAKSAGLTVLDFASYFENNRPDIVVVHGDRFEAMAVAMVASMMNIHVAHLQGGDITGTIDEHLRHAITKLSHFHFVTNEESRVRVCKLGEDSKYVFNSGCPSTDILLSTPECTFDELKAQLSPKIKKTEWFESLTDDFFLLIFHPVTTDYDNEDKYINELIDALKQFPHKIFALWPNVDAGSRKIVAALKKFERENYERVAIIDHVPVTIFVNLLRHAKLLIGNSSSGLLEACYFGTPVVNIGGRQGGRMLTKNVINTENDKMAIVNAINQHLEYGKKYDIEMPYGDGRAGEKIADTLSTIVLNPVQKKLFYND